MANPNNGPIAVSAPGMSLTNATDNNVTFNTKYPFAKLDSTLKQSFQIITLFFNTEPPNPSPAVGFSATLKTLVYSYPHGYSYEPSSWFLVSTDNFKDVLGSEGVWILGSATGGNSPAAKFEVEVDATNVNFYIDKFWFNDGIVGPPDIIGYSVSVRAYIFVEDLTGTSVPSHV